MEHLTDLIEKTLCQKELTSITTRPALPRAISPVELADYSCLNEKWTTPPLQLKWNGNGLDTEPCKNQTARGKGNFNWSFKSQPTVIFSNIWRTFLRASLPSILCQLAAWATQPPRQRTTTPCLLHTWLLWNYSCNYQNEAQLSYYSQMQASIHVTVLHRNTLMELKAHLMTHFLSWNTFLSSA